MLATSENPLLASGPYSLFLAFQDGVPVGRVCAGINTKMNEAKGTREGYFCLFECVNQYAVARALFNAALEFVAARGASLVKGPVSPTNGDEYRGVLVEGFQHVPFLFQSYNPSYYPSFFERYGFAKELDYLGYWNRLSNARQRGKAVEYAMRRYGFRIDPLDMRNMDRDIRDIKQVFDESMPQEWPDLIPPTLEELQAMGARLKGLAESELIRIARCGLRPIGVSVALPDYNQVLAHMNGRLFPLGWLKFLIFRRRIDALRIFILFIVPEFHKKGVSHALYHHTLEAATRLGYTWGDGSTVADTNLTMRRDIEKVGGIHYKTYRVYSKALH
jgi:GNAT superfamily N-acetyltransferase